MIHGTGFRKGEVRAHRNAERGNDKSKSRTTGKHVGQTAGKICCGRDATGCGPLVPTSLEKRVLAATVDGKRRSAGQRERIDVAVDASRLLGVAEPERQADIRRWLEFDAGMRAIAWQCTGRGVEGRKRAADAGIIFQ